MDTTFTTRKSESRHSATRWTVLLTVAMVAFSSPVLSHNGKRKNLRELLPTNIETPVEEEIALGPHPSDPAYAQYTKKFKAEVRTREELRKKINRFVIER